MLIKYNNIKVHKRELIKSGEIEIKSNGCYILKGKNGCGKTLWLRRLHLNLEDESVYIAQNNDMHIYNESVLYNISFSYDDSENQKIITELKNIGLDFLLDLKLSKMSGGEKS